MYFSNSSKKWIVVTNNINQDGVYIEGKVYYNGNDWDMAVNKMKDAFLNSSQININLINYNKSEWPAYIESGKKSIKQFKSEYELLSISGANDINIICICSIGLDEENEFNLNVSFNYNESINYIKDKIKTLLEYKNKINA